MNIKRYFPEFLVFFILYLILDLGLKIEIKFYHIVIIFAISYLVGKMIFKFLDVMPEGIMNHEIQEQNTNDLFHITFIIHFLSRGKRYGFIANYEAKEKINTPDLEQFFYQKFNRNDLNRLVDQGELEVIYKDNRRESMDITIILMANPYV